MGNELPFGLDAIVLISLTFVKVAPRIRTASAVNKTFVIKLHK